MTSPLLFNIMIADFPKSTSEYKSIQFADDITLICRTNSSTNAQVALQSFLNAVSRWATLWKFSNKFSADKSALVIFSRNKKERPDDPLVTLNSCLIPRKYEIKYLGLFFDSYFIFYPLFSLYKLMYVCQTDPQIYLK